MPEEKSTLPPKDNPPQNQETEEQINKSLENSLPPQVVEIIKDAPKEVKRQFLSMGTFFGQSQSPFHSLLDKFTADHIDKFLDYNHKDHETDSNLIKTGRKYPLFYTLIIIAFLVFVIIFLSSDSQLLKEVLGGLGVFGGGFGGGFGFKSYLDKKNK